MVKVLVTRHEDLSLIPGTCGKTMCGGNVPVPPVQGNGGRRLPEACWQAGLAKSVEPHVQGETLSQK